MSTRFVLIFILVLSVLAVQEIQPIHEKYLGRSLTGNWQKLESQSTIFAIPTNFSSFARPSQEQRVVFFNEQNGSAEAQFYYLEETQTQESGQSITKRVPYIYIRIYQNKYLTDRIIQFRFALKVDENSLKKLGKRSKKAEYGYSQEQDKWALPQFYTVVNLFDQRNYICSFDVELKAEISKKIENLITNEESIKITLRSDSITVLLTLEQTYYSNKYFYIFFIINCVQIVLMLATKNSRNVLFGTSEWLIIHTVFFLMFQCLLLTRISQMKFDTNLSYLSINSLLNVVVLFLVLRKFEKVFTKFTNKIWLTVMFLFFIFYAMLVSTFYSYPKFWVFENFIFLWQIAHTMINGGAGGVAISLVLLILLSRIPVFYILWTEDNFMRLQPNKNIATLILFIVGSHLLFIIAQKKFGSRLFVPKCIIPDYHDYIRWAYDGGRKLKEECSICSVQLGKNPESAEQEEQHKQQAEQTEKTEYIPPKINSITEKKEHQQSTANIQISKDKKIHYAETPCGHAYHQKCLADWLQINLVCPMCRRALPPMSENI